MTHAYWVETADLTERERFAEVANRTDEQWAALKAERDAAAEQERRDQAARLAALGMVGGVQ